MAAHPLDPLSAEEFRVVTGALRRESGVTDAYRVASIELVEPAKVDLLAWSSGDRSTSLPRHALAVLWDSATNRTYEGVVDVEADSVVSFDHIPGVQPNFTVDEWHDCDEAMRAHPDVIAALAARGIHDMSLVLVDVWTYGRAVMPEQYRDRRLGWADIWVRSSPSSNPYANPVAGLKLIVDMATMELLEIDDAGVVPASPVMGEYATGLVPGLEVREDLKPLHISQPEGSSLILDGTELRWQGWSMRLGFNYREGLVIHHVTYDDNGTHRPIAYRMSFAEMIVPYRDPTPDHYRRTAYDIGEWGLGYMTTSLELGCDCLGEITYLDAVLTDSRGEPYSVTNAICLHEEDNAVLWKHVDGVTGAEVRRMRRLVVSFHATVANYEYLVYWRFYQDGSIECEVRATGIMVTTPIAEGASPPPWGTVVDRRTYAPFHQHFLVARLDLDVDGPDNTVMEVDSEAAPVGPDNPYGLAVRTVATPVSRESEAGRSYSWESQRAWKVVNPSRRNAFGDPVAYKLVPTGVFPPFMDASAPQFVRAPVMGHQLWVTRHHDDERWPAGAYPVQSELDTGMTQWIADDEELIDTDVVLWYVFGIHHITRVEDWPVMPADTVSFWLKPFGFFDRNPSLDVAPSTRSSMNTVAHGDGESCHTTES